MRDVNECIQEAQKGNQQAFEELVRLYDRRILALAFQLVGNTEDAQDVYQDVFMRVYNKLHTFRFECDFFTWLYRIVVNCAISYRRKRKRHTHYSLDEMAESDGWRWLPSDSNPDPERLTMSNEIRKQIHTILETLPMMQRVVFVLRYFQDFKIRTISEIVGCSEGTVKNYIFRGSQKMKKELAAYLAQG